MRHQRSENNRFRDTTLQSSSVDCKVVLLRQITDGDVEVTISPNSEVGQTKTTR
jgi:hypothetical protein